MAEFLLTGRLCPVLKASWLGGRGLRAQGGTLKPLNFELCGSGAGFCVCVTYRAAFVLRRGALVILGGCWRRVGSYREFYGFGGSEALTSSLTIIEKSD